MRIVTRPDFDGIVCAVLIKAAINTDEEIFWVEPGEMQNGTVEIREGDIIANLPYNSNCSYWFDHHYTNDPDENFQGLFRIAPSAAGIVYEYYKNKLKGRFDELVFYADKIDSADLSIEEVRRPEDFPYVIISMTIEGRNKSDAPYWNKLVDLFLGDDLHKVISDSEVKKRVEKIKIENMKLEGHLHECTKVDKGVAVTDFRELSKAPGGNRFLVYSLFPEARVSVKIRLDNYDKNKVILSIGHSIFNKTCKVNAGQLLASYGGGGHFGAAACSFPTSKADRYITEILNRLKKNIPF